MLSKTLIVFAVVMAASFIEVETNTTHIVWKTWTAGGAPRHLILWSDMLNKWIFSDGDYMPPAEVITIVSKMHMSNLEYPRTFTQKKGATMTAYLVHYTGVKPPIVVDKHYNWVTRNDVQHVIENPASQFNISRAQYAGMKTAEDLCA